MEKTSSSYSKNSEFKNNLLHKIRYKTLPQNSTNLTRHELKTSEFRNPKIKSKGIISRRFMSISIKANSLPIIQN